jgi:hypothetical protein
MKRLFLIICLLSSFTTFAQKDTLHKSIELNLPDTNYINKEIAKMDSINTARDIEHMNSNFNSFYSEIRERQEKEKRQLWIRLGFFVATLILVIASFIRRRNMKKKAENEVR